MHAESHYGNHWFYRDWSRLLLPIMVASQKRWDRQTEGHPEVFHQPNNRHGRFELLGKPAKTEPVLASKPEGTVHNPLSTENSGLAGGECWSANQSSPTQRTTLLCERTERCSQTVKNIIHNNFSFKETHSFSSVPQGLRNMTNTYLDNFKRQLDRWLSTVPDEPPMPGSSNSTHNTLVERCSNRRGPPQLYLCGEITPRWNQSEGENR